SATAPIDRRLLVVPLAGGEPTEIAPQWDPGPEGLLWVGHWLDVTTADDGARPPVFRVTPDVMRLTGDDGCYGDLVAAPDGSALYALRSAVDAPPAPGRLRRARARPGPARLR